MGSSSETPRTKLDLYQAITIVVTVLGLSTACGVIPERRPVPPPPPPLAEVPPAPLPERLRVIHADARELRFGSIDVGATTEPQRIELRNTGPAPVWLAKALIVGEQFASFHMGKTCSGELAPGSSCEVEVHFQPRVAGDVRAGLIIDWQNGESQAITLHGTGVIAGR